MKQTLIKIFATQDKGHILSGAIARWLGGVIGGGLVWLGAQLPIFAMTPETVGIVSGFSGFATQILISDWVQRNTKEGVKEMQEVINAAGIAEPIPTDGIPGPVTIQAHINTVAAKI